MNYANNMGYSKKARDHRQIAIRHTAHNLPGMQRTAAQQARPVSVGDVQAGRGAVALLALRLEGGRVL